MSRQLDHAYATLVAEPMPGPQPTIRGRNKVNSSFRMEIVNTMQVPVFWRNALGIIVNEPPAFCDNNTPECLYITIEYEFDRQTQIDIRELLSEIAGSVNHAEAKGIVKSLEALNKTPSAVQRKFSYTLGVTREKLEQLGGVVYLNDVDLVVGFEAYRETALHPFSPPGQRQRLSMSLETVAGFNQQYLLVDNSGVYGNRWLNTGVTVVELNAIPDARLRDGVYVTTRTGPEKQPTTIHYVLEDADKKLGLYRNRAEAEAFGAPDVQFQAELKQQEQELLRDKAELLRFKQEAERAKLDTDIERKRLEEDVKNEEIRWKRHQEEIERQRERMKLERDRIQFERETYSERQKFEHDNQSRERKDRSEALKGAVDVGKAALGLISIGLSIYVLVKKNQIKG